MPSSAAISCTRGFATILLSGSCAQRQGRRYGWTELISSRSLVVHRSISLFVKAHRLGAPAEPRLLQEGAAVSSAVGHPQRPPEGPALDRALDALDGGMHPRTSTGHGRGRIHDHAPITRDDPQQGGSFGAMTAPEAGSYGFQCTPCGHARSVLEDGVGLDVDPRARELRGEAGVLALLADRERQLVVGHERAHGLRRLVDDERARDLGGRQRVGDERRRSSE